jgi:hypothetical protein
MESIIAAGACRGGASSPHCRQEAQRERQRERGENYSDKIGLTSNDLLPPARPHLQNFPKQHHQLGTKPPTHTPVGAIVIFIS